MLVQFCLAHLIRDVKYLCEFPDAAVQRYGQRLLEGLKTLFWTLHRKDQLSTRAFEAELDQAHEQIWKAAIPASGGPFHRLVWNMAERFAKHGEAYFQFITNPAIDPTNNVVEQALCAAVAPQRAEVGSRPLTGGGFIGATVPGSGARLPNRRESRTTPDPSSENRQSLSTRRFEDRSSKHPPSCPL